MSRPRSHTPPPDLLSLEDLLDRITLLPAHEQDDALAIAFDCVGARERPGALLELLDPGMSLSEFVRWSWPIVEPTLGFIPNWHIDCISEHLEAVTYGQIRQLLINIPPGHAKSLLVSVIWPAWLWLVCPWLRFLCASYAQELALRDAVRARTLMESPQYLDVFAPDWKFARDQNTKGNYANTRTGFRFTTSVGSKTTGFRGMGIILDDLMNVMDQFSPAKRLKACTWLDQAMGNRLNDPRAGWKVMIAQRLHEKDPCGHVLSQGGWEHVMLPSRYESRRTFHTVLVDLKNRQGKPYRYGTDPREQEGDLLFPVLFPFEVIEQEASRMGELAFGGQHQQNPKAGDGLLFKAEHFCKDTEGEEFYEFPAGLTISDAILSIDNNISETKTADFTAISVSLGCLDGHVYLIPLLLKRLSLEKALKEIMLAWARLKTGADGWPLLGEKLRMARIESGAAGTPVVQQEKLISAKAMATVTQADRDLAALALLKPAAVRTKEEREACELVATEEAPSTTWTQAEWDLVRSAPPLILNAYSSAGLGDIVQRATRIAPFCHARKVRMVSLPIVSRNGRLAKDYLGQHTVLPNGEHDDAVQATIGAVEPFIGLTAPGRAAAGDDTVDKTKQRRNAGGKPELPSPVLDTVRKGPDYTAFIEAALRGEVPRCAPEESAAVRQELTKAAGGRLDLGDRPAAIALLTAARRLNEN